MFFQLLSTIKLNLVAKILQSAYLCVIFHVKHKPDFLFLVKSKMTCMSKGHVHSSRFSGTLAEKGAN